MNVRIVKKLTYILNLFLLIISGYVYSKGSHFGIGFSILIFVYFPVFILTLFFLLHDLYLFAFAKESKLKSDIFFLFVGVVALLGQIIVNQIIQS